MKKRFYLPSFLFLLASATSYGMEKNVDKNNASHLPSFSFFDHSQNFIQEKISPAQWKKMEERFLERIYAVVSKKIVEITPDKFKNASPRSIFSNYYDLYQMLASKNKRTLKSIQKKPSTLLKPLGEFVATFEAFFDELKTEYHIGPNYIAERAYLENELLPIIQNTFNVYMDVYKKCVSEKLDVAGILKDNSQYLSVISEEKKKFIAYKKDENGFLLFTIFPHKKVDSNHYETYIPYREMRSCDYVSDTILFSLTPGGTPLFEERSGLIINKKELSIEPYRGHALSLPYTTSEVLVIIKNEMMPYKARELFSDIFNEKNGKKELTDEEKKEMRSAKIFEGKTIFSFSPAPPLTLSLEKFIENVSEKDTERVFVPFPHTPLEEAEATYLFLSDLQQRYAENKATPDDIRFIDYIEKDIFPGEKLEQIVQDYKQELVDEYIKEEEPQIRLEQETRRSQVATGKIYEKPKKSKKMSDFKKRKEVRQNRASSSKEEDVATVADEAQKRAANRLKALRDSRTGEPLKFRKFLQLVNTAKQELETLHLPTTAQLNKSSHGTLKVGDISQTIVQPHGGAKEKSISSKSQKKILTGLTEGLLKKFGEKKE